MDNKKFRRLLTVQYPIILIDEYQNSLKVVIDQFLNWFIGSQQVIVDVLNKMRPELPQITATDDNEGFVKVITCNDFWVRGGK